MKEGRKNGLEVYSKEHMEYLRETQRKKHRILLMQILILVGIVVLWQGAAELGLIDTFIASSPRLVLETMGGLFLSGEIYPHLATTLFEVLLGFGLGTGMGIAAAIALWRSETLQKVSEPYLVVLNALPKVALGPLIIVWAGAGMQSILIMTLAINLIVATIAIYSGFKNVDSSLILMMKTFGASKNQILKMVVLPACTESIIDAAKINVGMSFVGVIMGEFLVSKQGLGYLILYGSQVFNLDLVMAGIIILALLSAVMYFLVERIENKVKEKMS